MPTVAIAHTEERHLCPERVFSLVHNALEHFGGIEAFLKPGQNVLIQPNHRDYTSTGSYAAHPLVIGALVRLARNAGAGKIQVAGSSERLAIAAQEGAELIDLSSGAVRSREVDLPEGKALRRVLLPEPLLEADVIIAVPKAKTHPVSLISGAMDLWAGALNQEWHALHGGDHDRIERFADIMSAIRPDLCVTNALICGEGDGPLGNVPHWCGCILACVDPVATDVAIARLLGFDPRKFTAAAAFEQRGLGSGAPIVWLGTNIERVCFRAWPAHSGFAHLPVNVRVGGGVTSAGTSGHVKAALDELLRGGVLEEAIRTRGTPTILIGDVEDPAFEQHIQEGPYIVFDDAARPIYKNDARVFFVPGHPVLDSAMPQLMRGLGLTGQVNRRVHAALKIHD